LPKPPPRTIPCGSSASGPPSPSDTRSSCGTRIATTPPRCELLDTLAAIDPRDAEAVADRILAAIPEAVAALEANGVTPDQAAVLEAMPGWYAAMFTAAADYLCPQHAEAFDNAVANAARAQP
jgi:hypothetical protein